jgi:hypothetical protein
MGGAWSLVGLSYRKGKKIYRSYAVRLSYSPREMCGMLMTQSVYVLHMSLATLWETCIRRTAVALLRFCT